MSKKLNFRHPELTLTKLGEQLLFSKNRQHNPQMLHVLFDSPRVYQYVVYKDYHELIQIWLKHPVHVIHKDSRSIGYPEWHNQELVMTVSRPKSSLRYIRTLNPNLMISRPEVNLREHTGSFQLIQEVINPW